MDLMFVDLKEKMFQTKAMKASFRRLKGPRNVCHPHKKSKFIELPGLSTSSKLNLFVLIFILGL